MGNSVSTGQFYMFNEVSSCFWFVERNQSARRKPMQTLGEHANSAQEAPTLTQELKPGLLATVKRQS